MQDNISKILKLSDEQLKKTVSDAAISCGGNEKDIKYALSDISKLRSAIANLSQKDIDNLIAAVGEEKAREIAESISKNIK